MQGDPGSVPGMTAKWAGMTREVGSRVCARDDSEMGRDDSVGRDPGSPAQGRGRLRPG